MTPDAVFAHFSLIQVVPSWTRKVIAVHRHHDRNTLSSARNQHRRRKHRGGGLPTEIFPLALRGLGAAGPPSVGEPSTLQSDGESGSTEGHAGIQSGRLLPQFNGSLSEGNPMLPDWCCGNFPRADK